MDDWVIRAQALNWRTRNAVSTKPATSVFSRPGHDIVRIGRRLLAQQRQERTFANHADIYGVGEVEKRCRSVKRLLSGHARNVRKR
jgi:hypothetical protein